MSAALGLTATPRRQPSDRPRIALTNRRLIGFMDAEELLGYATNRARELFATDGCAILLVEQRGERSVVAVSDGVDAQTDARVRALLQPPSAPTEEAAGLCRLLARGFVGLAIACGFVSALAHLAWALPFRELPHRAGMATALALLGTAALFHLAAGWARRR